MNSRPRGFRRRHCPYQQKNENGRSLKVQQDVYRVPIRIGTQEMPALRVVDRQFAENFTSWLGQHTQQLLEVSVVENLSRSELPGATQLLFAIGRKTGHNHFSHAVGGPFHDVDVVGNAMNGVVKIRLGVEIGVKV